MICITLFSFEVLERQLLVLCFHISHIMLLGAVSTTRFIVECRVLCCKQQHIEERCEIDYSILVFFCV